MTSRETLIYLSIIYNGNWQKIYEHLSKHIHIPDDVQLPKLSCKTVTILDDDYPEEIRYQSNAPFVLFYYGDLSLIKDPQQNLAVVGTRNATEYGLNKTHEIVSKVAKHFNIISGLASGIDTMAHKTAIEVGGKTIAVLGCGIDRCYPPENKRLYETIKKNHLIISEYAFDCYAPLNTFPFRNRLIAMLSKGVLITEAFKYSGTSITASFAMNYNKDVMCVPYKSDCDSLCNRLIKSNAFLVEDAKDVLEVMGIYENEPLFEN